MGPPADEPGSPEGTLGFVYEGTGEERRISLHSSRDDGPRFTSGTDLPLVCRHPSRQTTNEASSIGRSEGEELEVAIRPASRKSTGTSARSISTPDTKDWTPSGSTSTHQTVGNVPPGMATGASSATLRGVSEDLQGQDGSESPMPNRSTEVRSSGSVASQPVPLPTREGRVSLFEEVIKGALDDAEESEEELDGETPNWDSVTSEASRSGGHDRWSLVSDARRASLDFNAPDTLDCRDFQSQRVFCLRVFEHKAFSGFFMLLTVYALFSPDMDQLYGSKESKFALSIVTTVVFFLYFVELFMQTIWRQGYICRAYFWLDLVALVSLLPDTWLIQSLVLGSNGAFAAGRSTKLARIIRLASRSTKATRLNRLVRIVRVASLLPRIASVFGKQVSEDEASKVLDKRLLRIFAMLDEDMDGVISAEAVASCKAKFKADSMRKSNSKEADGLRRGNTAGADSFGIRSTPTSPSANGESRVMDIVHSGSVHVDEMVTMRNEATAEPFDFEAFKKSVLGDELLRTRLTRACKHQVARSNNMQKIANKHSEDVGVKVALGVLALLLVLGLVEPAIQDNGPMLGMQYLDYQVGWQLRNSGSNWSVFPADVRAHIAVWADKVLDGASPKEKEVLYMDLQHQVFCNQLVDDPGRRPCDLPLDTPVAAIPRRRLQDIDDAIAASDYRTQDLQTFKVYSTTEYQQNPDKVPDEALEAAVTSTAVLYIRQQQEADAKISLYTTVVVIVIILVGIVLLTRDLSDLSLSLLKPLKVLAEDMQSIVHLQLAALSDDAAGSEKNCAEIRMIQAIFDNMKKAIKSWGKYVPWPVVQTLLKQGVDAKPEVREKEVSIFFSDIASFTSIVEHLAPDQSLLLLSKYFNEMSRVIDAHQGIVIEFIGDAILAVYGAPLKNPDHPAACVKAALRMLAALDKINAWAVTKELPQFSVRCGVHTGRVLVGNMGYHSRIKYGVVGEHAIVPERLEELNKTYNTKLLISSATCARLASDMFVTRPIDYVHISHVAGARADLIHQVLARDTPGAAVKHKLRPAASLYRRALRKYRERQFQQAMQYFAEVNSMITAELGVEDGPSLVMLKRCEAYRANPPSPNWDGVWSER